LFHIALVTLHMATRRDHFVQQQQQVMIHDIECDVLLMDYIVWFVFTRLSSLRFNDDTCHVLHVSSSSYVPMPVTRTRPVHRRVSLLSHQSSCHMCSFLLVGVCMFHHSVLADESFSTNITGEWLLPCV